MTIIIITPIILFLTVELIFFLIINNLRSKIPWIITDRDELPFFKKNKIKKFFEKTYDSNFGWNWKPNSKHQEIIFSKKNIIYFGKYGERKIKNTKKKNVLYHFASFGDSFVFCRFVKNNETWQEQIARQTSVSGLNLGVGNYGLDQIYLKYLNTDLPKNIKTIFIGFVPETLSRCLCSWKHYHEFNNIYAFKPKFINYKNKLKLVSNPIKDISSFDNINDIINRIKKNDFFYKEKFVKYKLSFPYFFSFFSNPIYNLKLIFYSTLKILNLNNNNIHEFIIRENCIKNDIYFGLKKRNIIIEKLMMKIHKKSKERGHKIIFLIFPQKHDLSLKKKKYHQFFMNNKKNFKYIDFTEIFNKNEVNDIYLPDQYGGHLTVYGNKLVADTIIKKGYI